MKHILLACAVLALGGCTTFFEGAYQAIKVTTVPDRGICTLIDHDGRRFAKVIDGETAYNVRRHRQPIRVVCSKKGFQDTEVLLESTPNTSFVVASAFTDALLTSHYWYPDSVEVALKEQE